MKTTIFPLFVCAMLIIPPVMASELVPFNSIRTAPQNQTDDLEDVWLTRTLDYSPEYYLGSGSVADTFAVHYSPGLPVDINQAECQFYTPGLIHVYVWDYSTEAESLYPTGVAPPRATSPVSPLGDVLFGPHPVTVTGSNDWETLFEPGDLPGGAINLLSGDDFMVGFVKINGEEPHPLADDISSRGTSYTWFCGPWTSSAWGGYHTSTPVTDLMMRVDVTYTSGMPPFIGDMTMLPDTPNPNKQCEVSAYLYDDGSIANAYLVLYRNNEIAPQVYPMTGPNPDDYWTSTFVLNGQYGDVFTYYVYAVDNEGLVSTNASVPGVFEIVAVPNKPLLFVDRGTTYVNEVQATLAEMGWQFVYWRTEDHGGVDKHLLDMGWDLVFVTGFGNPTVPTRDYGNDAYSEYLMAGGDMIFIDQDYFYTNGEPGDPVFGPGDFAYDFFGMESGLNDPSESEWGFYGMQSNPISGDWYFQPYILTYPDGYLWTDMVTPVAGNSEVVFIGQTYGNTHCYAYTNGFGGSMVVSVCDLNFAYVDGLYMNDDWQTLMNNLLDYYGVTFGPVCLDVIPWKTVLGSGGGSLFFDIVANNLTDQPYAGMNLWWDVVLPSGAVIPELFTTLFDLDPFGMLEWMDLTQCVPSFAPEGRYQFVVHAGYYPDAMVDDQFYFYKAAPLNGATDHDAAGWYEGGSENPLKVTDMPLSVTVSDAYPNPFNSMANLSIALPESAPVNVVVFNVMGQRIATIADGEMAAGYHTLTIDASAWASGLYFVRTDVPGQLTMTQKMVVVK